MYDQARAYRHQAPEDKPDGVFMPFRFPQSGEVDTNDHMTAAIPSQMIIEAVATIDAGRLMRIIR